MMNRKQIFDNEQNTDRKTDKRMPVWALVVMDLLLTGLCLCLFALYHHVLPRHLNNEEVVVATVVEGEDTTFQLPGKVSDTDSSGGSSDLQPDSSEIQSEASNEPTDNSDIIPEDSDKLPESSDNPAEGTASTKDGEDSTVTEAGSTSQSTTTNNTTQTDKNAGKNADGNYMNYGNSDTTEIYADDSEISYINSVMRTVNEVNSYSSDNIQFTTNKVEIGSGSDKITYYVSDIYVSNVKYFKTAFAYGEYGKNYKETTLDMAVDNNALLAINGDYYGNNEIGVVIRNGILYRSEVYDADLCVLYTDGTMATYSPQEFNLEDVVAKGAWQAWIFGPALLDSQGNVLQKFNSTYYLSNAHPRTAIGYVEPGHYVFVLVDGRDLGYSRGATLTELAQIMKDAGCVAAYNLDGGKSSEMVYEDEFVNKPWEGGRSVSDIIYIGE